MVLLAARRTATKLYLQGRHTRAVSNLVLGLPIPDLNRPIDMVVSVVVWARVTVGVAAGCAPQASKIAASASRSHSAAAIRAGIVA